MQSGLQTLIDDCFSELEDIKQHINTLSAFDRKVRYLTNYSLMRASGVSEFVYRAIIADYFSTFNDKRLDTYIDNQIRKGSMSAKYEVITKLLGKFDVNWKNEFCNVVKSRKDCDRLVRASNSLVENRHSFAHGRNPTATFDDIYSYFKDTVELIYILDGVVSKKEEKI